MPTTTATRERLTSAAVTLHHPLPLLLRAKDAEGLKLRTLNDHKSLPLPATLAGRTIPDAQARGTDRRPRSPVRRAHADGTSPVHRTPDATEQRCRQRLISRNRKHPYPDAQVLPSLPPRGRSPANRPQFSR